MRNILHLLTITLLLIVATSCNHKELSYDRAVEVEVVFDWHNAPDATPASMSLYLFPTNGGESLRYDFTDQKGGVIRVPFGRYEALCINSDAKNINLKNTERKNTFEVTTETTPLLKMAPPLNNHSEEPPRAEGAEAERIATSPDMLYTDQAEEIVLKYVSEKQTITLSPKVSVRTYSIEIRNAKNLKYVTRVSGSLSGLAGTLLPGAGMDIFTSESVTIPFDATIHDDEAGEKSIIKGSLLTFGNSPETGKSQKLTLYAVLSDGSKWHYSYDVTEQIRTAPDSKNVHIILDKLPLPEPVNNEGGLKPKVEPWNPVEINIEL